MHYYEAYGGKHAEVFDLKWHQMAHRQGLLVSKLNKNQMSKTLKLKQRSLLSWNPSILGFHRNSKYLRLLIYDLCMYTFDDKDQV